MSKYTIADLNAHTLQSQDVWHTTQLARDLGNIYDGPVPVEDVRSKLFCWEAQSFPLVADAGDIAYTLEGRQAIVRPVGSMGPDDPGEVLANMGPDYDIHQYDETLIGTAADLIGEGLNVYSAGILGGGRQAWVQVTVPDTIQTPEGVEFRPNLLCVSSMDGSLASRWKRTVLNAVCDNTVTAALNESGEEYVVKHFKGNALRLADVKEALHLVHTISDGFEKMVAELTAEKIAPPVFDAFLEVFAPTQVKGVLKEGASLSIATNKQDQLRHLWKHDMRVAPWAGTTYGVLQGVNTWRHYYATVKGGEREDRNMGLAISGGFDRLDRATVKTVRELL